MDSGNATNLDIWNRLRTPPESAITEIRGGRLTGKSDISPQWRWQAMTEEFGTCGVGWKFEEVDRWTQECTDNEVMCFVKIRLYFWHTRDEDPEWSCPIEGIGGSKLIAAESSGLHNNDEAWKMATTDALGTACKYIGLAADIYMGGKGSTGSKYEKTTLSTSVSHTQGTDKPAVVCPGCKKTGTIIKGKEEYGGGFVCWKKNGGCGIKWGDDYEPLVRQFSGSGTTQSTTGGGTGPPEKAEPRPVANPTSQGTPPTSEFTAPLNFNRDAEHGAPIYEVDEMTQWALGITNQWRVMGYSDRQIEQAARDRNSLPVTCPECNGCCWFRREGSSEKAPDFKCMGKTNDTRCEHGNWWPGAWYARDKGGFPYRVPA